MSLRTRIGFLVLLLFAVASANVLALHKVTRELEAQYREARITTELLTSLSALRYLALEYRLQDSERTLQQWESRHAQLGRLLEQAANLHSGEDRILFDQITENHAVLARLFAQVSPGTPSGAASPLEENQNRIVRQMLARIQQMIDDSTRLSRQTRQDAEKTFKAGALKLVIAETLLVLSIVLLVTNLQRSIFKPLGQLIEAARAVADGQERVRLPEREDPEFSLLFSSFNNMLQSMEHSLARLQEANQALALSNQDLSRFAYVASHDLQTPLRGIAGFVQLIESDYGHLMEDEGRSWMRRILQSTKLLQATIQDLLTYSRLDSNPQPFEPVELGRALESAMLLLEAAIKESGAHIEAEELSSVIGDESQLVQLFQNLINNAIKFRGDAAPVVRLTSAVADGRRVVTIRDNGIGIPAEYQQKIFEMFQRLHPQNRYPGTGIGLTICQRIMQRHGGSIRVESDGESGSAFIMEFPLPDNGEVQ